MLARTEAPRRLLVVAHLNPKKRGSLEQQFIDLSGALGRRGVTTHFVFSHEPADTVAAGLDAAGATWETLAFDRPLVAATQLARVVRRVRPGLVHIHFLRVLSPLVTAAGIGGAPVVVNDHMLLLPGPDGPRRWLKHAVARVCGAVVRRRVAVSSLVGRAVSEAEGVDPGIVRVIENGVDVSRFTGISRAGARAGLGLPESGDEVIGCVARMAPEKGVDTALYAFARVAARRPGAALLIAGDGPQQKDCRALAAALNIAHRVRFLGLRNDVERVIAASDQIWVPSRAEAFGLSAAEAMAGARPLVATRAGALDEVIDHGHTGWLVPVDDADEMAAASLALLADPERARRMGAAGRVRCGERFGMERFIHRVLALYTELLPGWIR